MSRTRRITALAMAILAFFIFVGSPFGQSAKAIVGVDDALIAIIIAALAAMGITFVTTGAYNSLQEYVGDLLADYAQSKGLSVGSLMQGTQSGTNKLGNLLLNNRFVVVIQGFAAWLKTKFSLTNDSSIEVVSPGTVVNGLTTYNTPFEFQYNNQYYDIYTTNVPSYALVQYQNTNTRLVVIISTQEFTTTTLTRIQSNGQVFTSTFTRNSGNVINSESGVLYYWDSTATVRNDMDYPSTFPFEPFYTAEEWKTALAGTGSIEIQSDRIEITTGTITLPEDSGDYAEGDGAVIDLQQGWGSSYDDVIDGIEGAFSDSGYADPTITYEGEETVQDQVEDTPTQSVSQEVNDYQSPGLQDVFPFCIPFDIYAFFECLAAEPVAPSFTWRFYVPGICDEEIELDLSEFDTVAQIVRTMELLAFIVGLALVTRNRFLRG